MEIEELPNTDKASIIHATNFTDFKNSPRVGAFDNAIQKYVGLLCEEKNFANALARTFKPIYRADKEQFMKKAGDTEQVVKNKIVEHLTEKTEQFDVRNKLFLLDMLQQQNQQEGLAWRPSGNPTDDIKAYLYAVKVKYVSEHKELVDHEYQLLEKELHEKLHEYKRKKELFAGKCKQTASLVKVYEEQIENIMTIMPEIRK